MNEINNILNFESGILGFEKYTKYTLKSINDYFYMLSSLESDDIGFVVLDPFKIINEYQIEISSGSKERLNINSPEDILVLNIVTLGENLESSTVNLKAPLIINIKNMNGEQIIIDKNEYEIKQKLFRGDNIADNF